MSSAFDELKVVALAGGVGGAKLVFGLDRILPAGNLSVIVNTGDDFEHFGLKICPDLDTVCYTLANMADPKHGWGLMDESYAVSKNLAALNAPTWFTLGDRDLATHMERTRLLNLGWKLSEVTAHFCKLWRINSHIIPMSEMAAPTMLNTKLEGTLSFQEYFVKHQCQPDVLSISYEHNSNATASESALRALEEADLVVICPSNPLLSIAPILSFKEIERLVRLKKVIAVSPIIQGKALKGPAAKLYKELGFEVSSKSVLKTYQSIVDLFVYDELDSEEFKNFAFNDIIIRDAQTIMKNDSEKIQLANTILKLGKTMLGQAENG